MNAKKLHLLLIVSIVLLFVGLVAGAYGINSLLTTEAKKLTDLKAKSQALAQEEIGLIKAKKDIEKYSELEKISKAIVPEDKSQAEAVREIVNIAAANGVTLGTITFPASNLGVGVGGKAAPSAAATRNADISQLVPVPNISGVYQLPITVSSDSNNPVPYSRFVGFLEDLENNRRTAQVSTITLQPAAENRNLISFSLTLNNYIKP